MWGLNRNGDLGLFSVATGAFLGKVDINYPGTTFGTSDLGESVNSLSFTMDGSLLLGGSDAVGTASAAERSIWRLTPDQLVAGTTQSASIFYTPTYSMAPGGWSGDFVTMADGSLVGFANATRARPSATTTRLVYIQKTATGFAPAELAGYPVDANGNGISIFGGTYAQGSLYLGGANGRWYRLDSLPAPGIGNNPISTTLLAGTSSSFYGATGAQESLAACSSPDINVAKTVTKVTGPDAAGVFTSTYSITVNNGNAKLSGTYGPLTDTPAFDPKVTIIGAYWSNTAVPPINPSGNATGPGPYKVTTSNTNIGPLTTHTYTISIQYTVPAGTSPTPCTGPGSGNYNTVSLPPDDEKLGLDDNSACSVNASKTATSITGPDANGDYVVNYAIKVTNMGNIAGSYGPLTDTPTFDPKATIKTATFGRVGQPSTTITGPGPYALTTTSTSIAANAGIPAGTEHHYTMSIVFNVPKGVVPSTCRGTGTGSFNAVSLPPGTEVTLADNSDCLDVPAPPKPVLALTKTGTLPPAPHKAGDLVTYSFVIKNTGTIPASNLTLTDAQLWANQTTMPVNATTCATLTPSTFDGTLAPGASVTCVAAQKRAITQEELNAGKVVNNATAGGESSLGIKADPAPATSTVTPTRTTSLQLAKDKTNYTDVNGNGATDVGDLLFYTFTLTNTGNVALKNPVIEDTKLGLAARAINAANCRTLTPSNFDPAAGLAPGSTLACEVATAYTITAADVANGHVLNVATSSATTAGDNATVTSNQASKNVPLSTPASLSLVKTASAPSALDPATGHYTVAYAISLKNSGETPTTYALVDTPQFAPTLMIVGATWAGQSTGSATGSGPYALGSGTIGANQTLNWTVTVTFTYVPGTITSAVNCQTGTPGTGLYNTASVGELTSDACVNPPAPPVSGMSIDKIASPVSHANPDGKDRAGDIITYTFVVKNTGNVTLTEIAVNDPKAGTITCPKTTLLPQESMTCTAEPYKITQGGMDAKVVINTASVTAKAPPGVEPPPSPSDSTTTPLTPHNAMTLDKTRVQIIDVDGNGTDAGDDVYFSFTITNTGTSTLSNIHLKDASIGVDMVLVGSLAPGASITIDKDLAFKPFVHTLTQAEIDAGRYVNTGDVTATGPGSEPPFATDTETTLTTTAPSSISLHKESLPWGKNPTITDVNNNGVQDAGDTITYRFVITNTSTRTLTGVSLTDTKLNLVDSTCGDKTTLLPKETTTCDVVYALRQADVNAGVVTNSAVAEGTDPDGNNVSGPGSDTVPIVQTASIKVVKTAGQLVDVTGDGPSAGDTIDYTIVVTNNGATALTTVIVKDPILGADIPVAGLMQPGDSRTIERTYKLTQADVDNPLRRVKNVATGSGTPPSGVTPPQDTSTVETPFVPRIGVALDKQAGSIVDANGNGKVDAGDTIAYTFVVTNTGNTTITSLTLTDAKLKILADKPLVATGLNLLPQQKYTFSEHPVYTLTQDDIDAGSFANTGIVTGDGPAGPTQPTPGDAVSTFDQLAGLDLKKTAGALSDTNGDGKIGVKDKVSYTFTLTNITPRTLKLLSLTDAALGYDKATLNTATCAVLTLDGAPATTVSTLNPGQKVICQAVATHELSQADVDAGFYTNVATANAVDTLDRPVSSTATSTVNPPQTLGITVKKSNGGVVDTNNNGVKDAGDHIVYSFLITNTSNVTLSPVLLTDKLLKLTNQQVADTLAPGASITWTAPDYVLTADDIVNQQVVNDVDVIGTPPGSLTPPTGPDRNVIEIAPDPRLTLAKSASFEDANSNGFADRGEVVKYTFTVTNTGNTTLTNIAVDDPLLVSQNVPVACKTSTLAPGEQTFCTATMVLRQAVLDAGFAAGNVKNVATAHGLPPGATSPVKSAPAQAQVPIQLKPELTLEKRAQPVDANGNGFLDEGDEIYYSFALTNTGTASLHDFSVSDPRLTGAGATLNCPAVTLLPGQSLICEASTPYVVTSADVLAKKVDNAALASAKDPNQGTVPSKESTVSVPLSALALRKTATLNELGTPNQKANVGETITYAFELTNAGSTQLTHLSVTDISLGKEIDVNAASCILTPSTFDPVVGLAPGETVTCTLAPIVVTKAQVDAGVTLHNVALAYGITPSGSAGSSKESTADVPVDTTRSLSVVKTAVPADATNDGRLGAGDTIVYSFVVTNTGAVTIRDLVVNDQKLAQLNLAITCPVTTLDAGASTTCTSAAYTITPTDVTNKQVYNEAIAGGTPPSGPIVTSPPGSSTVPLAGLFLEKQARLDDTNGNTKADAGERIAYSFVLRNTGGSVLKNLTVTDSRLSLAAMPVDSAHCVLTPSTFDPSAGLGVGEAVTCELRTPYVVSADDVAQATPIVNNATASAKDPGNVVIPSNPSGTSTAVNAQPAMTVLKSSRVINNDNNPAPSLRDEIEYSFLVTNTGNTNVTSITIVDDFLANAKVAITCPTSFLAPGASTTCTSGRYIISADDVAAGAVMNTALVEAKDPVGGAVPTPPPSSTVVAIPGLKVTKTATLQDSDGNGLAKPGEKIKYTFLIENTGGSTLKQLAITDQKLGLDNLPVNSTNCVLTPSTFDPAIGLAVHTSVTCQWVGEYTVTQADVDPRTPLTNVATASGSDGTVVVKSPESVAQTPVDPTAKLTIDKKVSAVIDKNSNGYNDVGDTITYTFVIKNIGAVTLTSIKIQDAKIGAGYACPGDSLAAGQEMTCTSDVYTITADDVAAGKAINTATATGVDPGGKTTPTSPPSTATALLPGLSLTKSGSPNPAKLGDNVSYTFTFTNTGQTRLTALTLTDAKLGLTKAPVDATTCATLTPSSFDAAQGLAPGQSVVCTAAKTYQVSQADVDAKTALVNKATAGAKDDTNGGTVPSKEATSTVPVPGTGALKLTKSVEHIDTDGDHMVQAGEVLNYSFLVTNVGTLTMRTITIDDPMLTKAGIAITCPTLPADGLAPGASTTCTAGSYTVTPDDIAAKKIENVATGSGKDPGGVVVVTPPDKVTTPITPLTLVKQAQLNDTDADKLGDIGETITYRFTLRNVGKVALLRPSITDKLLGAVDEPVDAAHCATLTPPSFDPNVGIAPGASVECVWKKPYTLTAEDLKASVDVVNVATAQAELPSGAKVPSQEAEARVPIDSVPRLALVKSAELTDTDHNRFASKDEVIIYGFKVTNVGQVPVHGLRIEDPMLEAAEVTIECPITLLEPGQSTMCYSSEYRVTPRDMNRTIVHNVAIAVGSRPDPVPAARGADVRSNESAVDLYTAPTPDNRDGGLTPDTPAPPVTIAPPKEPTTPDGRQSMPLANTGGPWWTRIIGFARELLVRP